MVKFVPRKPIILIAEDDPHGRDFMESSIEMSGFEVVSVDSAEAAREAALQVGLSNLAAVISDYRLPGKTGIALLEWIRSKDSNVSTIMITGQGEKSIVEQSISVGVFEYLEKPVTHQVLREVMTRAAEKTALHRQYESDREGLQALENLGKSMNVVIPEELQPRMRVFYRPLHEVGGDFLIIHKYGNERYVFLVGDISGHDIRSGYVSTYFQGMFKGSLESGGHIENAFTVSNKSLRARAQRESPDLISLSLSAIDLGPQEDYIQHWNYGFTPCCLVSASGRLIQCPTGRYPLGWFDDIETSPLPIQQKCNQLLYLFTDGLADYASQLEVNTFSLLYRCMREFNGFADLPVAASDDIFALRYLLNSAMDLPQTFEPLLSEHYAGTECEHIDHLQANWRRSITFALGDRLGDRLYDLLVCIREGMLNALIHGCGRSAEKFAHLQVSINEQKDLLRIYIDDPGKGHSFNLEDRLAKISQESGKNLGLGIIHHLSDTFRIENKGTSLVFDFQINPDGKKNG
ncbi:MAG: response regulator [Opitutales bacterium]|jgi:sigma-B regulation protein RsbU (phosphoserine phosphatase)